MPLKILLADDQALFRQSLRALLEREGLTVVAEAVDGRAAMELARIHRPDVAVLDLSMPLLSGLDAAREIVRENPETKTLLLTIHDEHSYVLEALRLGIRGYVLKMQVAADLVRAIEEVARGRTYLSPGISEAVVAAYRTRSELPSDPLTPREREVLQLVAAGKSTKQVANILHVSVKTAESHRTHMMNKLDIHETASLVRYAIRRGLIEP